MITGDLDRALAASPGPAGTWRPPPAGMEAPGTYVTPIAFALARQGRASPAMIATSLVPRLAGLTWIDAVSVTGGGYLSVRVTPDALATLAVRITQAGPGCARSGTLASVRLTAPRHPGLPGAATWPQARRRLAAHLSGRLGQAAGATVSWEGDDERLASPGPSRPAGAGPVAEAIAIAGADAVTFALCRLPPGSPDGLDPWAAAAHHLRNPAYAVRYAHSHAASILRQAADLGLARGDAAGFRPRLLAHPSERALLERLSWLPERVAGAARRGRPDVLARYLEGLAGAYLGCQECSPAVWPGMRRQGSQPARPETVARLWLAAAARVALAAGLSLLGVAAPDRL